MIPGQGGNLYQPPPFLHPLYVGARRPVVIPPPVYLFCTWEGGGLGAGPPASSREVFLLVWVHVACATVRHV